jgi:hypothetical protein
MHFCEGKVELFPLMGFQKKKPVRGTTCLLLYSRCVYQQSDYFVMNTQQIWPSSYKTDSLTKPICFPEIAKPYN